MYSVKIKDNIKTLFSVLDNTVPGSSPYAVNKTILNSDTGFTLNVSQSNAAPTISLIQGSSSERFTIGTVVTSGTYRYAWIFKSGSSIKRQIASVSFSNGFVINSLPVNPITTGYVSYNHPDSSVYAGIIAGGITDQIPIIITVYDTNAIQRASLFTCTQIGVVFIAVYPGGGQPINTISTLINVGETLNDVISDNVIEVQYKPTIIAEEITYIANGTFDYTSDRSAIVVYSTAIFSITY